MKINRYWYHHVQNDEVRLITRHCGGQSHLSAIVQAWRFSLFGHTAQMPDETDAKIFNSCPFQELGDTTRMPLYYVDEDYPEGHEIQQPLSE